MGHRCCGKQKVKRGLWSPEEDEKLIRYITTHGHASWSSVPKLAGLQRCGKSCRLRWINYLRPDLKRGSFTSEEEQIIIDVHRILGNRWAQIAKHLPGRTDNEVKNFWNSCIKKKLISQGLDPRTHNLMPSHKRAAVASNSKATCNNILSKPKQQQHQKQKSAVFSIVTVNPQSNRDASMKITNLPALSAPPLPPPSPPHNLHQNSEQFLCSSLTNNVQDCHDPSIFSRLSSNDILPIVPNSLPSYSSSLTTSMLGLIDESSYCNIWGASEIANESFQPQTMFQANEQGNVQEKGMPSDRNIDEMWNKGGSQDPMDVSFESSSFDLDFTTLISSAMSTDFIPMDDFAWTF